MKKHRLLFFAFLAVCLLWGVTVAIKRRREDDTYRGQSLQAWAVQAYQRDSNAVVALKELGTNAIPGLIRLLRTNDSFMRRQTWTHLPKLPPELRRTIARKYAPPQAEVVREAAAHALGRLGADANVAIPQLSRALRDHQGRVRWEAATALGSIGKASVPVLISALDENDAKVRQAATSALGQIGPEATPAVSALASRLSDSDQAVRNSAAYSLTTIGLPGFLALVEVSHQARGPARTVAARILTNSYLPHMRLSSELLKMAKSESPTDRLQAIEVMGAIHPVGGMAIYTCIEALKDPVLEVRLAAIETLGAKAGADQEAVQALMDCLSAEPPRIRGEAAKALGQIGDPARIAMPALARLTQDKEEAVSAAARSAMAIIGQGHSPSPRAN